MEVVQVEDAHQQEGGGDEDSDEQLGHGEPLQTQVLQPDEDVILMNNFPPDLVKTSFFLLVLTKTGWMIAVTIIYPVERRETSPPTSPPLLTYVLEKKHCVDLQRLDRTRLQGETR